MWTCPTCSRSIADAIECCPRCDSESVVIVSAPDPSPRHRSAVDVEGDTEYDVSRLRLDDLDMVESYIGIDRDEARDAVARLRNAGIPAALQPPTPGEAPSARVRVPTADLIRAMAVVDRLCNRPTAQS